MHPLRYWKILPQWGLRCCHVRCWQLLRHTCFSADNLPCRDLLPRRLDGGDFVCGRRLLSQQQLLACHLCCRLLLLHALCSADHLPRRKLLPRRLDGGKSVCDGKLLP